LGCSLQCLRLSADALGAGEVVHHILKNYEAGKEVMYGAAASAALGSRQLLFGVCCALGPAREIQPVVAGTAWPASGQRRGVLSAAPGGGRLAWLRLAARGQIFGAVSGPQAVGRGRGLGRPANGYARARAGVAKATLMKRLVQYMLSDAVQGNASAYQYAPMSQDTVRPRAAGAAALPALALGSLSAVWLGWRTRRGTAGARSPQPCMPP